MGTYSLSYKYSTSGSGWTTYNTTMTSGGTYIHHSNTSAYAYVLKMILTPGTNKIITQITLTHGIVYKETGSSTITVYLLTADPSSTSIPSSYITTASQTISTNASGTVGSFTFTGLNITAETTLYAYFATSASFSLEVQGWRAKSGNVTSNPSVTITEIDGSVYIYDSSTWKMAIPYVYDGSAWKQAIPYVYDGSAWKQCGG